MMKESLKILNIGNDMNCELSVNQLSTKQLLFYSFIFFDNF